MKRVKYSLLFIAAFFINSIIAFAAPTHSISVSRGTIENGQNVTATVTIKNVAAWNVHINGTGNTNGCSTSSADATSSGKNTTKSFSVTCKSNSTGIIKISYSGDATSEDGSTTNLSGSKTVTVVAPTPKSTNNYLKSITITDSAISPEFNKETLEYTATLEAGTQKAVIAAEKEDGKAYLEGAGEFDVIEGENRFEIKVTSESGSIRTYVVVITVKEFDPIIVNINNNSYSVVRKAAELTKPESFIESTVTMGDDVIPAFYSEITKLTLVGLKDENGVVALYIYNEGKYTRYLEFKSNQITLNFKDMKTSLLPEGYKKYSIAFNNEEIEVYKLNKDSKKALVYATDVATGKDNLYEIDLENNTFSIYSTEYNDYLTNNYNKLFMVVGIVAASVILIEFIYIIFLRSKTKKILKKIQDKKIEKVKKAAIKEAENEKLDNKVKGEVKKEEIVKETNKEEKKKSKKE